VQGSGGATPGAVGTIQFDSPGRFVTGPSGQIRSIDAGNPRVGTVFDYKSFDPQKGWDGLQGMQIPSLSGANIPLPGLVSPTPGLVIPIIPGPSPPPACKWTPWFCEFTPPEDRPADCKCV